MRVTSDVSLLRKELKKYSIDVLTAMEKLVVATAEDIVQAAQDFTPVGDAVQYRSFYIRRQEQYKLPVQEGYHQGAWVYSESPDVDFVPKIVDTYKAVEQVKAEASSKYQIGETFYIAAKGPAYSILNSGVNNQAPEGILEPAVRDIIAIQSINIHAVFRGD